MNESNPAPVTPEPTVEVAAGPLGSEPDGASDDQRIEEFCEFGIFEWHRSAMLLAHVNIAQSVSSAFQGEQFLLITALPESLERLSQHPSEVISLWLFTAGVRQPRQLTADRVVDVARWQTSARDCGDLLVLRCESGEAYGLDQDGVIVRPPPPLPDRPQMPSI